MSSGGSAPTVRQLYHRPFASEDTLWTALWASSLTPHSTQPTNHSLLITAGVEPIIRVWKLTHQQLNQVNELTNNKSSSSSSSSSSPPLSSPYRTLRYSSGISCLSLASAPFSVSHSIYPSHLSTPIVWSSWMDGTIKSFSPRSGRFLHSIDTASPTTFSLPTPAPPTGATTSAGEVWSLAHHPTRGILATGTSRGQIRVWDVSPAYLSGEEEGEVEEEEEKKKERNKEGREEKNEKEEEERMNEKISSNLPKLKERQKAVDQIQQSKRGWEGLAKISTSGSIKEISSVAAAAAVAAAGTRHFTLSLEYSSDGTLLSSGHYSGLYQLFDVDTGKCLAMTTIRANTPVRTIRWLPSLLSWSVGDDKGRITFLDTRSASPAGKIEAHSSFITSLIYQGEQENLSPTPLATTHSSSASASSLLASAVSSLPSSLLLISASCDQTIKLHDLRMLTASALSNQPLTIQTLNQPKSPVWNLSKHPQFDKFFAAVTEDAAIRIFST